MRQHYVALFAQDDWRAARRPQRCSYGLRYEFVTDPKELNGQVGRPAQLRRPRVGRRAASRPGTPTVRQPVEEELRAAPRRRRGTRSATSSTTVQGGYGHLLPAADDVVLPRHDVPHLSRTSPASTSGSRRCSGPATSRCWRRASIPAPVQKRSEFIFYDAEAAVHAAVARQRRARARRAAWSAKSATSDRRGTTCRSTAIRTRCRPSTRPDGVKRLVPGATLRYPSWGRIRTRTNVARSIYHGMTLGLNKRFTDGWHAAGRPTPTATADDTWSGGQIGGSDFDNGAGSATDWWDPEYEFGPSNFDVRHNLVVNGVYLLPLGRRTRRAWRARWPRAGRSAACAQFSQRPAVHAVSSATTSVGDLQSDTGCSRSRTSTARSLSEDGGAVVRSRRSSACRRRASSATRAATRCARRA